MMSLLKFILRGGRSVLPALLNTARWAGGYYVKDMATLQEPALSLSDVHDLIMKTCPPSKPGACQTRIFINKDLSLLAPENSFDEVYPGIFLGDKFFARDKEVLLRVGITHLINAAEGNLFHQVDTKKDFYDTEGITYLGIRALDTARFKMEQHFQSAADFIEEALESGGTVAVHCVQGMSRSAALVMGYLMLKKGMRLEEAITTVRIKRAIFPNDGFLKQLIALDHSLLRQS